MRADFKVVLDSCVLIPMPLVDTLLRLAGEPRLYLAKWTHQIMAEVNRNLVEKFGLTEDQAPIERARFGGTFLKRGWKAMRA